MAEQEHKAKADKEKKFEKQTHKAKANIAKSEKQEDKEEGGIEKKSEKEGPITYTCDHCSDLFASESNWLKHSMVCQPNTSSPINHRCRFCKKVFYIEKALDVHEYKYCTNRDVFVFKGSVKSLASPAESSVCDVVREEQDVGSITDTVREMKPGKDKKVWHCVMCDKTYLNQNYFERHMMFGPHKNKKGMYSCEHCDREFSATQTLSRHEQAAHLYCHLCNRSFGDEKSWEAHQVTEHGAKLAPSSLCCDICGERFHTKRVLANHVKMHEKMFDEMADRPAVASEKPVRSSEQPKAASKPPERVPKQPVKTSEKPESNLGSTATQVPYKECPWKATDSTSKVESEAKQKTSSTALQFKCKECPRKYRTSKELMQHQAKHINSNHFYCHQCDVVFYRQNIYIGHMKIGYHKEKDSEGRLPCVHGCGNVYFRLSDVRDHELICFARSDAGKNEPERQMEAEKEVVDSEADDDELEQGKECFVVRCLKGYSEIS